MQIYTELVLHLLVVRMFAGNIIFVVMHIGKLIPVTVSVEGLLVQSALVVGGKLECACILKSSQL